MLGIYWENQGEKASGRTRKTQSIKKITVEAIEIEKKNLGGGFSEQIK